MWLEEQMNVPISQASLVPMIVLFNLQFLGRPGKNMDALSKVIPEVLWIVTFAGQIFLACQSIPQEFLMF